MVVAEVLRRFCGGYEVGGNQVGALVQQLEKRMLAVGARLAPDHRSGMVRQGAAVAAHCLAVAFHVGLLQVGRETMQMLVIGQDRVGRGAEEIDVPDAEQRQGQRQVLLGWRGSEMLVHVVRAGQQFAKLRRADCQHDRQADRRPQRVAPAHPVPEFEHVCGIDAEIADTLGVGRDRDEMPGHRRLAQLGHQPCARAGGIGHGLLRGEGLGRDDEQRGRGVERGQGVGHVAAVDIGNETELKPLKLVGMQRGNGHDRAKVAAADADIDHGGDAPAGGARPFAAAHRFGEGRHAGQHLVDCGHHVLPVHPHRRIGPVAQRRVQYSAVLGGIDALAGKHSRGPAGHVRLGAEPAQQAHGLFGHPVLRIVQQQVAMPQAEARETVGLGGEQVAHVQSLDLAVVAGEGGPGGGLGNVGHEHGIIP